MKINQILDKIDEYQLFVPAFQREYVWKRDDAKKLIASLIKDYPTGTMLTWETNNPPELKGAKKYDSKQGAVKLILDGQQRITTLYMLIRGEFPPYYTPEEIVNDTRNLYVQIESLELQYYKKTQMENNPVWLKITDIFQKNCRVRDIVKAIKKVDEVGEEREDRLYDNFSLIERIPEREFLEQSIPIKANIREAIDIFYIVNASGVNLTEAELALAQISGYWPEARERFKKKLSELADTGFVFKLDFIIYVILGVLHSVGSEMQKLHAEDNLDAIQKAWERLENYTLDYVFNLMKSQAFIDHTKEINSVYALVPIIVYSFRKGDVPLSQEEINKIVKWFYYSQIRQRYISQMPQKLDKDIGIVVRSENPFDELLNIIKAERPLEISPDEFVGVDVRNALFSLMRWYFKSRNAVCLTTGIGIRQNMGKRYSLEYDHIFPYSVLKTAGYEKNRLKYALAQEITNRAILTQVANRTKSNKLAEDYLGNVIENFPNALELQVIPSDDHLWKLENYEHFLKTRRMMLAERLNTFLQSITDTTEAEVEIPLDELIKDGETNELEFKSSLRWSYQEGCVNKKLEQVILKSVAAFNNGEGGTLLIGVDDDSNILGLAHDCSSLRGNRDEFELHLRNLLNSSFGVAFVTQNVTISFPTIDSVEICRVDVKRSNEPLFLQVADKHGVKSEKFYVRSGNSSQEIKLSEINTYMSQRFEN